MKLAVHRNFSKNWDSRIKNGVIKDLAVYPLSGTTAIHSSFTQYFDIVNVTTSGGYNGMFLEELATGI
ncbi:hypothetical protein KCP71_14540 [Salmonella enterica subsp. enterica]|nr:hypothetical protein KCP71_14540 [Salmonella enterica subsp. enterica]